MLTDTEFAPWYIVHSDDKKRARLNIIRHVLKHVPYERAESTKVRFPRTPKAGRLRRANPPLPRRAGSLLSESY